MQRSTEEIIIEHPHLQKPKDTKNYKFYHFDQFLHRKQYTQDEFSNFLKQIDGQIKKQHPYRRKEQLRNIKFLAISKQKLNEDKLRSHEFVKKYGGNYQMRTSLDFRNLEKEIKKTANNLQKKKYNNHFVQVLNSCAQTTSGFRPGGSAQSMSSDKKRKRFDGSHLIQTFKEKSYEEAILSEKIKIFKNFLPKEEIEKMQQKILLDINKFQQNQSYPLSQKLKFYIISHSILQKVLELIFQDTRNINIKLQNQNLYMKMKEEMVAVLTDQESVGWCIKEIEAKERERERQRNLMKQTEFPKLLKTHQSEGNLKFANKKKTIHIEATSRKIQKISQIEEAIQTVQRYLKEAFLAQKRPDQVFSMEFKFNKDLQ